MPSGGVRKEITLFMKYSFFGGIGASCDFLTFYVLNHLGIILIIANTLAICLGIGISFALNSKYTFKQSSYGPLYLIKFFVVGLLGLLLSTVFLKVGSEQFHHSLQSLKIVSLPLVAAFQFTFNRLWTFRKIQRN